MNRAGPGGSAPRDSPPTEWFQGVIAVGPDTYARPADTSADTIVWHWCAKRERWEGAMCSAHTLHSREPLHLEPSLVCHDCGWHGWIRNGRWEPTQ